MFCADQSKQKDAPKRAGLQASLIGITCPEEMSPPPSDGVSSMYYTSNRSECVTSETHRKEMKSYLPRLVLRNEGTSTVTPKT